jgi:hypothetical protein
MLRLSDASADECGKLVLWGNYWGMFEASPLNHITTLVKSLHERSLVGGERSTITQANYLYQPDQGVAFPGEINDSVCCPADDHRAREAS